MKGLCPGGCAAFSPFPVGGCHDLSVKCFPRLSLAKAEADVTYLLPNVPLLVSAKQ